jgi:hypothetical protein
MGKSQGLSESEDEWQRQATAAAIAAARKVVLGDSTAINKNTPVGRLSDPEWGWIITAAIFGWIAKRAEQATAEGLDVEAVIRTNMLDPNPWDAGMVATMLPKIADLNVEWTKPLVEWSRESMIAFLVGALDIIREGTIARDLGGGSITRKTSDALPADPILS